MLAPVQRAAGSSWTPSICTTPCGKATAKLRLLPAIASTHSTYSCSSSDAAARVTTAEAGGTRGVMRQEGDKRERCKGARQAGEAARRRQRAVPTVRVAAVTDTASARKASISITGVKACSV